MQKKIYKIGFYLASRVYLKIYFDILKVLAKEDIKVMVALIDKNLFNDIKKCNELNSSKIDYFYLQDFKELKFHLEKCYCYIHEGVEINDDLYAHLKKNKTKLIYAGLHWLDSLAFPPSIQNKYDLALYASETIFKSHNKIINKLNKKSRAKEFFYLEKLSQKVNFVGTPLFDNWQSEKVLNKSNRDKFVIFMNDPNPCIGNINSLCLFSDLNIVLRILISILNLEFKCLPLILKNHSIEYIFACLKDISESNNLNLEIKTRKKYSTHEYQRLFEKYNFNLVTEPNNILDYRNWMRNLLYQSKCSNSLRACSFSAIDSILAGVENYSFNNFFLDFKDYFKLDNYMYNYNRVVRNPRRESFWNYKNVISNQNWESDFKFEKINFDNNSRRKYFLDKWGFIPASNNKYTKILVSKLLNY